MLFNSFQFLVFFPLVTALYFALPLRGRWALLLIASAIFYMAFIPKYLLIILGTIVVDYVAGLLIERSEGKRRKLWLIASIVANVGALAIFKYCNFFIDNANEAAALLGVPPAFARWDIILPVGLSFHTFQAMSYTIEVYRGNVPAERNLAVYALYVLFYPQLVAGPIERPQNIIHQLRTEHRWDPVRATHGLQLMLWGFFKKVVVADRLAQIVDAVYAQPEAWSGPVLVFATICFAFQIYADFSGYSDIAIGASQVMGIRLMTNFRQPYLSRSVSEFWSRWHISLSTWFRDYVYIPLGGNRVGAWRQRFNLMFTFLLSGFWHGASWTFVVWGGLNGLYLVIERELKADRNRSRLGMFVTFALVSLSWVFFRADTISDATFILSKMPTDLGAVLRPAEIGKAFAAVGLNWQREIAVAIAGLALVVAVDAIADRRRTDVGTLLSSLPRTLRWTAYYALGFSVAVLGHYGQQQFIYFQF